MTLLTGVGPEPMAPLAERLRAAGKLYQWLRPLLTEAADALDGRTAQVTSLARRVELSQERRTGRRRP